MDFESSVFLNVPFPGRLVRSQCGKANPWRHSASQGRIREGKEKQGSSQVEEDKAEPQAPVAKWSCSASWCTFVRAGWGSESKDLKVSNDLGRGLELYLPNTDAA